MLQNEEIHQQYPLFSKGLNDFEDEWITCGCICTVRKKEWKDHCSFVDIECQKLISHSVIRWLSLYSSFPRMLQMYPVSFLLHVHRQTTCWSETFFWKFSERTLFKTHVKTINCWGCTVSCFANVEARIQMRWSVIHINAS